MAGLEREVERWQGKHAAALRENEALETQVEELRARAANIRAHTPVTFESDVRNSGISLGGCGGGEGYASHKVRHEGVASYWEHQALRPCTNGWNAFGSVRICSLGRVLLATPAQVKGFDVTVLGPEGDCCQSRSGPRDSLGDVSGN